MHAGAIFPKVHLMRILFEASYKQVGAKFLLKNAELPLITASIFIAALQIPPSSQTGGPALKMLMKKNAH